MGSRDHRPRHLRVGAAGRVHRGGRGSRIAQDGQLLLQPLLDLTDEVNTYWTRGMTGLALAPDFEVNGYLYLAYTVDWEYYSTATSPRTPASP